MERKIEKCLLDWKNKSSRLPMLVKGARQVGKTYTILKFAKQHYKNVIYLNFETRQDLHQIFDRNLSTERLVRELSIFSASNIFPGDSLIFFDEIQACERALTSMKYFAEESPAYHIIAAGSLLGVAINRESFSFPVGKIEMINLYPMDFEEYLWAIDQKKAVELIRESFEKDEKNSIHEKFLDHYIQYVFSGGMPQVLKEYTSSDDYNMMISVQKNISDAYIADMAKYTTVMETVRIMAVYNSIPSQLARENRKFQYKVIKTGARASMFEAPIEWLKAAGIIIKCEKVRSGLFPLQANKEPSSFKIYLSDTGLLSSKYGIPQQAYLSKSSNMQFIKGILAENYVASALLANGYDPFYWESDGKAEVDFVIQTKQGEVIPIEVKSSHHVRSKSLQQFVLRYKPHYSIRISTKNFGFENNIKSVPLYAVFCL